MIAETKRLVARIAGKAVVARLGYFRAKIRAATDRPTLVRETTALLTFLRRSGCSFHGCGSLISNPVPMGIAYRYDIHVRDIPGSLVLADYHRTQGVPATFFLFWDYSPFERQRFRDYCNLRKLIVEPLEMGLHDSPIDAFLIKTRFSGDRRRYARWTASEDALKWLGDLSSSDQKMENLHEATLEDFVARVRETRSHFGPFALVAGHGGELGQNLRAKLASLPPPLRKTAKDLRARFWLTPERVTAAGLERCVDWNDDHSSLRWREVSDNGGEIAKMAQMLSQRLTAESAVVLLLHPYTWAGAKRDAELSQLLNS